MAAVTGAQGDGDVDDVRYPGGRAPGAYPQRQPLIERDDPGHRGSQQARETGLRRAASPGLSEDSGRDGQFGPAGEGLSDSSAIRAPVSRVTPVIPAARALAAPRRGRRR
jgi:hypothetical protein